MASRHTSAAGTDLCMEAGANYGLCLPQAHTFLNACVFAFVHLSMHACPCVGQQTEWFDIILFPFIDYVTEQLTTLNTNY
jgi:hypothetical protein